MIFITGDATCIATLNLKRPYLSVGLLRRKRLTSIEKRSSSSCIVTKFLLRLSRCFIIAARHVAYNFMQFSSIYADDIGKKKVLSLSLSFTQSIFYLIPKFVFFFPPKKVECLVLPLKRKRRNLTWHNHLTRLLRVHVIRHGPLMR
jgi:hypothetical protein